MTNILEAINNISQLKELKIKNIKFGNNRAVSVGEGLESFVKDSFTNTFNELNKKKRQDKYNEVFSYQGSKRTPPDLMVKGGIAIEVKKTESLTSELQLNSSHPKAKLYRTSKLINQHCRDSKEDKWSEKDFVYIIGHIPKGTSTLSSIWFIDGSIYAADEEVYLNLKDSLTENLENISEIDFSPTNEIGRVNFVDPLKITNLRIRGMWLLQPPFKVFDYVHKYNQNKKFQCIAIISLTNYNAFPEKSKKLIEDNKQITIEDIETLDPNNSVAYIKSKLIRFEIEK
jgi:hypothetical protein